MKMTMLTKTNKNYIKQDERGFASIVIALILIVVLSLLTVGFAQLARREQQTALSNQLASQARYAAETGINDVYKVVSNAVQNPTTASPSLAELQALGNSNCLTDQQLGGINSTISSVYGVSYSCVLLNLTPSSFKYDGVGANSDRSVKFSTTGIGLSSFTVKWRSADGHSTPRTTAPSGSTAAFDPSGSGAGQWGNSPSVIQLSITPLDANVNVETMNAKTFTAFLYPSSGSSSGAVYSADSADQGKVYAGSCTAEHGCSVTIAGVPITPSYAIHLVNYYDASHISIGNALDSSGNPTQLKGGQAVIDATGKAKNVLKRLQVHVPLSIDGGGEISPYPIEVGSLCKRISTYPGASTTTFVNPDNSNATTGPCYLNN